MHLRRTMWRCCALVVLGATATRAQGKKAPPKVEFTTSCSCVRCHGKHRWSVKTETDPAPASIAADHRLTPSALRAWKGPGGKIGNSTPRTGRELEWYTLTGEIRWVRLEDDGDIHLQLVDRGGGPNAQTASVEIPVGEPWCAIRDQIFALTSVKFPLRFSTNDVLPPTTQAVVTVVGRAFYDAENDGGDSHRNDRDGAKHSRTTVWEIHPVMQLTLVNR